MPLIDLSGTRFGRLFVIGRSDVVVRGHSTWVADCDCGRRVNVISNNLRRGLTRSCGCFAAEQASRLMTRHGYARKGRIATEHKIWMQIIQRCRNPNDLSYKNYGGRGIRVCDRWANSFEAFLSDMGHRPSKLFSIDRINNDGNYEPGNCRWATAKQQAANRRPRVRRAA